MSTERVNKAICHAIGALDTTSKRNNIHTRRRLRYIEREETEEKERRKKKDKEQIKQMHSYNPKKSDWFENE